ncbi:hypothetical protein ABDJ41_00105 [Pedobacter sp. ASV1-7]|uniref:hypothetical protein n=1 Tax=Pedobacter sp. ASV1-7 TaxID=3145237 RepID=UPI0032E87E9D
MKVLKFIVLICLVFEIYGCSCKKTTKSDLEEESSVLLEKKYKALSDWVGSGEYTISYKSELLNKVVSFKGFIKDVYQLETDSTKIVLVYGLGKNVDHVIYAKISINEEQFNRLDLETKDGKFNRYGTFIIRPSYIQPHEPNNSFIYDKEESGENSYEQVINTITSPILIEFKADLIDFYIK